MGAFDGITNWVKSQYRGYDVAANKRKEEETRKAIEAATRTAYQRQKTPQAKKALLSRAIENERDKSWVKLDNGTYVQPKSQNNLSAFSDAAATNIVYNNPLSPLAWQNWIGSGAEYLGTATGNKGLQDFGSRQLNTRRQLESFNNQQAMDQRANAAGNAVGSIINAGTLAGSPVFQGKGVAPTMGRWGFSGVRYGLPSAADTAYAIRQNGGSRNAQTTGGLLTGTVGTFMGARGLDRMGAKNTGAGLFKNILAGANAEGLEEVVEYGVDDAVARATYDKDRSWKESLANAGSSYAGGAFAGGLFSGANARYGVGKTETEGKQQFKQDAKTVNDNVNHGVIKENLNKKLARRETIRNQKKEALRNGDKKEYQRLDKVEGDLSKEIKGLELREKITRNRLGMSLELTNDAELNAQNNTEANQSLDQGSKIVSSDTNIPRSQLSGKALSTPNQSLNQTTSQDQAIKVAGVDPIANALGITTSPQAERISGVKTLPQDSSSTISIPELSNQDVEAMQPEFNALTTNPNSKKAKRLEQAILTDDKITRAAIVAQENGEEFNYFAKKDSSGRGVGIEAFDPLKHRIESGLVVNNQTGNVEGTHIKVDPNGVEVNVGGQMINMSNILGDLSNVPDTYKWSETMERNIYDRWFKGDKKSADKLYNFTIGNKLKNENNYRTELNKTRADLKQRADVVKNTKPRNVSNDQFNEDIFAYIENRTSKKRLSDKYAPETVAAIDQYKKDTRMLYDTLLDRANETFARFGEKQIPKRKDYITHINELMGNQSFTGEMYGRLRNSALGEMDGNTRKGLPAEIAGRTGEFEPRKRWNPFAQERKGSQNFEKDPFKAVDAYLEPTLYNIHMTESAVRARSVESAIRTAQKFQEEFKPNTVKEDLVDAFKDVKATAVNGDKLVNAWQEYANALAGKTNAVDRAFIDKTGDFGRPAMSTVQALQRTGGRATILGNVQSVMAQTLGAPATIAHAGGKNTIKGLTSMVSNPDAIKKSRFVQSRITNVASPFRSTATKALDAAGVPLEVVEQSYVKATWYAMYEKAKSEGYTGDSAIREADRLTERTVAGRGIADKPEVYRSTLANTALQYTLEVNAQNKLFWKDFSPVQKAEYMVGAAIMNSIFQAVTGYEPLPDFIKAAIDSVKDWAEREEGETVGGEIANTAQRFGSEAVSMNPFLMALFNQLPQSQRKKIFGEDSEVGRYSGQMAAVNVLEKGVSAADNLIQGNYGNATSDILKGFVPAGNQINKTATGVAMNQRGYAVDKSGNPTYAAPSSTAGQAKAAVFGPYSTREARDYFNNNGSNITGEADVNAIRTSANPRETVNSIQTRRAENKSSVSGVKTTATDNSFSGLVTQYNDENTRKDMTDTEKKIAQTLNELPQGISDEAKDELVRYSRLTDDGRKKRYNDLNNQLTLKLAEYERDTIKGTMSTADKFKAEKDIAKLDIGTKYGNDVYDMYSLAKYEIENLATPEMYNQLLAYDWELYQNGLISSPKLDENKKKTGKGRGGVKTALNKAISFATPSTPSLPAFKLSGGQAPSAKLAIPSVRTSGSSPKGRQYTVKVQKLS